MDEREQLRQAMATLEMQRGILGDGVVEAALGPMREKLTALEALAQPAAQRRKLVTVFFADVSGFTSMSESLDAEDVINIMNMLWQQLDAIILAHGGRVDKHMGDGVMALWGAETARENDAEQAVRAALAMQATLQDFNMAQGLAAAEGGQFFMGAPTLQLRIGINTGPVLLGEVGLTQEFTAMGDTVNVASRLEQAAPLGGVLLSHDTYRHVRGIFEVQTLTPIQVKGKTDPVKAYVVLRAKPRAFRMETRGVEGVETRMVGRETEFQQLQKVLETVVESRKMRAVTVMGEAGVGKSRLLYEFQDWAETLPQSLRIFKGRASESLAGLPYTLLRDLFSFRFQFAENDPLPLARQKLEQGVVGFMPEDPEAVMKAHFIGHLIGLDFSASPYLQGILEDARQIRDRALHYMMQFFSAVATSPGVYGVVLLLEDLQWADDGSLDALTYAMSSSIAQPILIIGTARSTLLEHRPAWGKMALHSRLNLLPLSKSESRQLVEEILQKMSEIPQALRELVVGGAEGNPFYIEELIKMLIDEGVIIPTAEQWRLEAMQLALVQIPPTLTKVLQARLDSLTADERRVLQQAAVVGMIFWDNALVYLNRDDPEFPPAKVLEVLSTLRNREMVFRREGVTFVGTQAYTFKHTILQEVTYESVLRRDRRAYHAAVANWLMAQGAGQAGEVAGLIAKHLELAGETVQARGYLRRAAEQAAAQFANAEAVSYFTRALEMTPGEELIERYNLLAGRDQCYLRLGDLAGQEADTRQMLQLAQELGDLSRQIRATIRLVEQTLYVGNTTEAQRQGLDALVQAWRAGDRRLEADLLIVLGNISRGLSEQEQAERYYAGALAIYRAIDDRRGQAQSLLRLATATRLRGRLEPAYEYCQQSLSLYRALGDRAGEGATLNALGITSADLAEKRSFYEQSLAIAHAIGDRDAQARAYNNLALVYCSLGFYVQARDYLEADIQILREMQGRSRLVFHLESLGRVYLEMGDYVRAEAVFQEGLALALDMQDSWSETMYRLGLGRLMLARHALTPALEQLQWACTGLRDIGTWGYLASALAWLGTAYLEAGDWVMAYECASEAVHHLQTAGNAGDYPAQDVWWLYYRILRSKPGVNEDDELSSEAREALLRAYAAMDVTLASLSDEGLRCNCLEKVRINHAIAVECDTKL